MFCGKRCQRSVIGKTLRKSSEWERYFAGKAAKELPPLICLNPLDGQKRTSVSGEPTFRGNANVADFRYCLLEFDDEETKPIERQLAFFSAVDLPLVALVYSGGKSIHAWLRVRDIRTLEDWQEIVAHQTFERVFRPLGADPACKTASRLGRLPGALRHDKGKTQDLLYLDQDQGRWDGDWGGFLS